MSSPNYVLKAQILKTDLCPRINAIDRQTYINEINGIVNDQALEDKYFALLLQYGLANIQEARKSGLMNGTRARKIG